MGTSLVIDRIDLADTGQPTKLAELLIEQLVPQLQPLLPLPIENVAMACGIEEIQELVTEGFDGGLIQNPEKTRGFILVKAGSRPDRRRFTISHELGHFLNPYHRAPPGVDRFLCTSEHMRVTRGPKNDRLGIEAQANEFAAHLLMPQQHLRSQSKLWGSPQIQSVLDLQSLCQVSKEAAARRFVELHGDPCAIVFSRDGKVRYVVHGGDFPSTAVTSNSLVGRQTLTARFKGEPGEISDQEEADVHEWLRDRDAKYWEIWEEVLMQQDGFRMTLLLGEKGSRKDDEELENRWTPRFR